MHSWFARWRSSGLHVGSCQGVGQKANRSAVNHFNRKTVFISQTCSEKSLTWIQTVPWKCNVNIVNINDTQLTSVSSLCCEMESQLPYCNARRSIELNLLWGTSSVRKKHKFSMTEMDLKYYSRQYHFHALL